MSLRDLVGADCGGHNPLMQLGSQLTRPLQNEGLRPQMMNPELAQQVQQLPQTFHLAEIMKEIQQIEERAVVPNMARAINGSEWSNEFMHDAPSTSSSHAFAPAIARPIGMRPTFATMGGQLMEQQQPQVGWTRNFFEAEEKVQTNETEEWMKEFEENKAWHDETTGAYNKQFWDKLQAEWNKVSEDEPTTWLKDHPDLYDPYQKYQFEETNPMIDVENPLEKGKAFLAQGDVPSAVLCFEASVKQAEDNAEAWKLLGTTQAENENDPNAIPALKKALELSPGNLDVLMSLAVSYTNESYQNQALRHLTTWLTSHPKYSRLVQVPEDISGPDAWTVASSRRLQQIQSLFLNAVATNPQEVDADVQEALGVLFNLSSEYDKAVDCFQTAVSAKPDNAKTWNRLGASLANGNRNIEAVEAYQNALELEPGFIRARYNVGIICINLKSYNEAAEHLLMALNHQASSTSRAGIHSTNPMSDSIWNTLRMAVSLAGKHHLSKAVETRDLAALNAAFTEN